MVTLSRNEGETFLIYPSLNADVDMTVAELFKDGPIRVKLEEVSITQTIDSIDVPETLRISRL